MGNTVTYYRSQYDIFNVLFCLFLIFFFFCFHLGGSIVLKAENGYKGMGWIGIYDVKSTKNQ